MKTKYTAPLQKKNETEQTLRSLAFMNLPDLFSQLESGENGLTSTQADARLDKFGENTINTGKHDTVLRRLYSAIINPFNVVLLIIAAITFFTDVIYATRPDYLTVSIILLLVGVSSGVSFIQGERSNSAAAKLSEMISNKADVLRDGKQLEIEMKDVVPGDIVYLAAGDMLPADLRFLSTKDTFVAQSALTGESNPVEKYSQLQNTQDDALTDLTNIGFMGSNIVSGSASGIALSTGNSTYIGSMAKSLSGDRAKNSFERGVDSVSSLLVRLMFVMVPIVFMINGFTKKDWGGALLFAISIAVGLMPEMLPVIMTSTLAKGAVSMSKQKVIVKTLGAIQTFGEMDILCTDKTGTLTEDKIVLEKYMDVQGNDDKRILRHAYLNSYFQTGLKNLIDVAIINRATTYQMDEVLASYHRIDEIPFDFSRRRMSVVLEDKEGKRQLITKGAVEEILGICTFAEIGGKVVPFDDQNRAIAKEVYESHNAEGLRMIGIAQKNEVPDEHSFGVADESEMVLIGFVGFLDPPKESAATAIAALKEHGVRTVVLTGDSEGVAIKVCQKVGIKSEKVLTGADVEGMNDARLEHAARSCDLFAKLSPAQKERVVRIFQGAGHTVGYMGDGINDAPPLHQADVGISVDSAVDIAKETADIILLEKDLMVLEHGVLEGRRTFGNIVKYIKMAASGNFGNMISVIVASIFLPFLPMLPVQILAQNLLCDFSQMGIPFDNVDPEYLKAPRKWETGSIKSFMLYMGPLSSIFDILCFAIMWWIIGASTKDTAPLFQCGWFVFGTVSQVLVIHMIRTAKLPFIESRPAKALLISTLLVAILALAVAFSPMAIALDMHALPLRFAPWLALLLVAYCLSTQLLKKIFIKRTGQWL